MNSATVVTFETAKLVVEITKKCNLFKIEISLNLSNFHIEGNCIKLADGYYIPCESKPALILHLTMDEKKSEHFLVDWLRDLSTTYGKTPLDDIINEAADCFEKALIWDAFNPEKEQT